MLKRVGLVKVTMPVCEFMSAMAMLGPEDLVFQLLHTLPASVMCTAP